MTPSPTFRVKVGNGGHYALMYGDNNIFVSIGDADNTDRFVAIGDYRALEGVNALGFVS